MWYSFLNWSKKKLCHIKYDGESIYLESNDKMMIYRLDEPSNQKLLLV